MSFVFGDSKQHPASNFTYSRPDRWSFQLDSSAREFDVSVTVWNCSRILAMMCGLDRPSCSQSPGASLRSDQPMMMGR